MNWLKKFLVVILLGVLLAVRSTPGAGAESIVVSPLDWYIGTIQKDMSGTGFYDYGIHPSIAVHPLTGSPHVTSFSAGTGLKFLTNAFRLENIAGNCNGGISEPPVPFIGWHCPSIVTESSENLGYDSAIAFDASGNYGIAYKANGKFTLKRYDKYESPTGTTDYATTLTSDRSFASVAYDSFGTAFIAYDGWFSGGSGLYTYRLPDSNGYNSYPEIEYYAAPSLTVGNKFPSIDVTFPLNMARIAYQTFALGYLNYAENVSSGTETSCRKSYNANVNPYWRCFTVDATTGYASYISLYASKDPLYPTRIAYYDPGTYKLKLATKTGSGNCGAGTDTGWNCVEIDTIGTGPSTSELGISLVVVDGNPVIAYIDRDDQSNSILKLARYVTSGGNCGPSNSWYCEVVDDGSGTDNLESASLAYHNGIYYIAYHDKTQRSLRVAHTKFSTAPSFSMSYSPAAVLLGNKTHVTYTIKNNMADSILGGVAFTHSFAGFTPPATFDPASLSMSPACAGTVTFPVSNHAIKLVNGILGKGATCTISVDLRMDVLGTWNNTTSSLTSEAVNVPGVTAFISAVNQIFNVFLPLVRR